MPNAVNTILALLPGSASRPLLTILLRLLKDRGVLFRHRLQNMTLDRAKLFGKTFARECMAYAKHYVGFFTSMLPENEIQQKYNMPSEGTTMTLKNNHWQNPPNYHKYMTNLPHEFLAEAIEYKQRQSQLKCLKHITNLPYELRAIIMDQYFEAILVPGEVGPVPCMAHQGSDCFSYNKSSFWCRDALHTMGSKIYNRYHQRYWSENTVVSRSRTSSRVMCTYPPQQIVSPRRLSPNIKVLETLPREITDSIRSMRLVLGRNDDRFTASEYDEGKYFLANYTRQPYNRVLQRHELVRRWFNAGIYLANFKLQHLVIDLRDAYSTDGKWLGLYWARRLFEIECGRSRKLKVIGPNPDLEKQVRCEIDRHLYGG